MPGFEQRIAVKATLTLDRPRRRRRRYTETKDFGAMLSRMIRAYGNRVKDADPEDLTAMVAMRDTLDEVIVSTIAHMRSHQKFSWTAIGEAVGTTRQAAQQRYGARISEAAR
jgi:RecB family exonuclease